MTLDDRNSVFGIQTG